MGESGGTLSGHWRVGFHDDIDMESHICKNYKYDKKLINSLSFSWFFHS
jgi:hypothetical protein